MCRSELMRKLKIFDEKKIFQEAMRAASSVGDRPVQAKCLVCVGDIQRSQNNNEVIN